MIKIVYLVSTLRKTGPTNVLYNIIRHLDKKRYEVYVVSLSPEVENLSALDDFMALGINFQSLNLSRLKGYLYGGLKLKEIIDKINPDIVSVQCFRTILLSLFLPKYKKIAIIHCDYDVDYKMLHGSVTGFIMSKIQDFVLKKISNKVCVSELLCELLQKKKKLNLGFVDNGIDTNKFQPAINKADLRQKLNLPADKKIWIWAGVMIERKNPLLLVEAIEQLNTDDVFVFCGDGILFSKVKEAVKELKNVILAGNVDNIEEYLQASDYYISTSFSEGLPMSVIEAMSCGLPMVLSDIEQHKYILKEGSGVLFKTNDTDDLISKMKEISKVDYNSYSSCARESAQKYFSSVLMSENYQKKYEDIMIK